MEVTDMGRERIPVRTIVVGRHVEQGRARVMRQQQPRRRGGAFRTFAAFGLGAAAGSIIALLYAPASGKVTRRKLAMRAQALRKNAVRRIGQTQKVLAGKAIEVREAATEWLAEHMPNTNGNGHRRVAHHA